MWPSHLLSASRGRFHVFLVVPEDLQAADLSRGQLGARSADRGAGLVGIVGTVAAGGIGINHEVAGGSHEVGVSLNKVERLELGDGVVHEVVLVVVGGVGGGELGDPDRLALADGESRVDLVNEGGLPLRIRVPVDGAEVEGALAVALVDPLLEVAETLVGVARVGDGGSTDTGLSLEGVHVLDVPVDGIANGHVGLGGDIRLVEGEDSLGAGSDGSSSVLVPGAEAGRVAQHGDEADGWVEAIGGLPPVVSPAAAWARVVESVGKASIVVSLATLAAKDVDGGTTLLDRVRSARVLLGRRKSRKGGDHNSGEDHGDCFVFWSINDSSCW